MACVLSGFLMFQVLSPIYLANNNPPKHAVTKQIDS